MNTNKGFVIDSHLCTVNNKGAQDERLFKSTNIRIRPR